MVDTNSVKNNNKAFQQILVWSGILFVAAILVGFLYRIIYPVELHLDESEYQTRVFAEFETPAWRHPDSNSALVGVYEPGSILYVIDEQQDYYRVRPFIVSRVDSVWVLKDSTTAYSSEEYRRWQYEEERRKYDLE